MTSSGLIRSRCPWRIGHLQGFHEGTGPRRSVLVNLLLDFQVIESGIRSGAPKAFSWFAAFGLMVTIVWLYIEMLRLLAIIAARRG